MRKLLLSFFLLAVLLTAANLKLYMKDGGYQIVREYRVEGDRVKFYSVERSEWEEMPVALIDLKRTQTESQTKQQVIEKQAKEISEEDAATRALQAEIMKIPQDPGVYMLDNGSQLRIFKLAESTVHSSKGRTALRLLSGIPFSGKATLEIPEAHSQNIVKENRPEFYIQLAKEEAFGIIKLTPKGNIRIAERLTVEPIVKETLEERDSVQVFTKQLTDSGLYKIWPQEPLEKGEYAVIEYTEGKLNPQIWDFRIE
ncbi:MAG TPA: hypothetical protein VG345_09255 [Bryobacteraceae bacterium]|nr:hypothetical protein [Bryobacteraceae bacterium]